jgi:hypothetical protein
MREKSLILKGLLFGFLTIILLQTPVWALLSQYRDSIIKDKVAPVLEKLLLTKEKYNKLEDALNGLGLDKTKLETMLDDIHKKVAYEKDVEKIIYAIKQILDEFALAYKEKKPLTDRNDLLKRMDDAFYYGKFLEESALDITNFNKDEQKKISAILKGYITSQKDSLIEELKQIVESSGSIDVDQPHTNNPDEVAKFLGGNWGGALGSPGWWGRPSITEAKVVDGYIRVTKRESYSARLMLEAHFFFPTLLFGVVDCGTAGKAECGHGPFVAFEPGASGGNLINSVAAGWLLGFRNRNSPSSFNVGLGLMLDPKAKFLANGQEEDKTHPLCVPEVSPQNPSTTPHAVEPKQITTCTPPVDLKEDGRVSLMAIFSFSWGGSPR